MHCKEIEKLNCMNAGELWGDQDEHFNLELENFGVDLDAINDTPTCLKRIFCYWTEKWGETLLKDIKVVVKNKVAQEIQCAGVH